MPLTRAREEFFTGTAGVDFLMEDSDLEVPCRATREMLPHRFGSYDEQSDAAVFDGNREEIERAASDKYDAGNIDAVMVILTGDDMTSPLSQKI